MLCYVQCNLAEAKCYIIVTTILNIICNNNLGLKHENEFTSYYIVLQILSYLLESKNFHVLQKLGKEAISSQSVSN